MSCHKDCGDGEEVIGKLSFVLFSFDTVRCTVNHEFCASLLKDEVQQVASEATEPVLVQHHNLFDQTVDDAFQNGCKPLAFEVEATPDVGDELVLRVRLLQLLALSLKIAPLVGGGDPSVDDTLGSFRGLFLFVLVTKELPEVVKIIQSLALTAVVADMPELALPCPGAKGLLVDLVPLLNHPCCNKPGSIDGSLFTFWHVCPTWRLLGPASYWYL